MHDQARARERRLTVIEGGAAGDEPLTATTAAIVLDSTADLPDPQLLHPQWRCVPLTVSFGERDYADGVDWMPTASTSCCRSSRAHPKTSAPVARALLPAFADLAGVPAGVRAADLLAGVGLAPGRG